jgi:translation elongation factor EF-G
VDANRTSLKEPFMVEKKSDRKSGAAPVADAPDRIRNVVLVGPAGSGKTTLMESLLLAAGATSLRAPR